MFFFVDYIRYRLNSDGTTVTVSKGSSVAIGPSVTIPANVTLNNNTYDVVAIEEDAFYDRVNLSSITIPASVLNIYDNAFRNCSNLESVTFLGSRPSIGSDAFLDIKIGAIGYYNPDIYPWSSTDPNVISASAIPGLTMQQIPGSNPTDSPGSGSGGPTPPPAQLLDPVPYTTPTLSFSVTETTITFGFSIIAGVSTYKLFESIGSNNIERASFTYVPSPDSSPPTSLTYTLTTPTATTTKSFYIVGYNASNTAVTRIQDSPISVLISIPTIADIGGVYYRLDSPEPGKATVSRRPDGSSAYQAPPNSGTRHDITIPPTIEPVSGLIYTVVAFDNSAFAGSALTSIIINANLTTISDYAFNSCDNLESVTFPPGLTRIGFAAFVGCSNLNNTTLPASITSIGDNAFEGCTSLNTPLPAGLTSIGDDAFKGCTSLNSITLPAGLTSIGTEAFLNAGLQSVTFLGPKPGVGNSAFYKFNNNTFDYDIPINANGYYISQQSGWTNPSIPGLIMSITPPISYTTPALSFTSNKTNITFGFTSIGAAASEYRLFDSTDASFNNILASSTSSPLTYEIDTPAITTTKSFYIIGYKNGAAVTSKQTSSISVTISIPTDYTDLAGVTYTLNNGVNPRTATVVHSESLATTTVTIPATIEPVGGLTYTVTAIGYQAFYNSTNLNITLSEGITSIGNSAFANSTNLNITIPTSLTSFGENAFANSTNLNIMFSEGITSIGNSAFANYTGLTSITLPASLISIGIGAFTSVTNLTSITLPASLNSIGEAAFYNSGLTTVTFLGNKPATIDDAAFYNDTGAVPAIGYYDPNIDNSIWTSGEKIGGYAGDSGSGLTMQPNPGSTPTLLPPIVYEPPTLSFNENTTTITFNFTAIAGASEYKLFDSNNPNTPLNLFSFTSSSLTYQIDTPTELTEMSFYIIGYNGVARATSNQNPPISINIDKHTETNGVIYIISSSGSGSGSINNAYAWDYIPSSPSTEITIPQTISTPTTYTVIAISASAFNGSSITKITLSNSVTSIGNYAFSNCAMLNNVTLSSSLTSIGIGAFSSCVVLEDITLPDSLTTISIGAFYGCNGLSSIEIPANLISIGYGAFGGCTNLNNITFPALSSLTTIGQTAFQGCTSLSSIEFPAGLTSIGDGAFFGCTNLNNITFPALSSLTTIGQTAFQGCTSLSSIEFPTGLTSIGDGAFFGCTGLLRVIFPNSPTTISIGDGAFYGCSFLMTVIFRGNKPTVVGSAFDPANIGAKGYYIPGDTWSPSTITGLTMELVVDTAALDAAAAAGNPGALKTVIEAQLSNTNPEARRNLINIIKAANNASNAGDNSLKAALADVDFTQLSINGIELSVDESADILSTIPNDRKSSELTGKRLTPQAPIGNYIYLPSTVSSVSTDIVPTPNPYFYGMKNDWYNLLLVGETPQSLPTGTIILSQIRYDRDLRKLYFRDSSTAIGYVEIEVNNPPNNFISIVRKDILSGNTTTHKYPILAIGTFIPKTNTPPTITNDGTGTGGGGGGSGGGAGGGSGSSPVACLPTGQRILTANGWRAVETLRHGDMVITDKGTAVPATIYSSTIKTTAATAPITIPANLFGRNAPAAPIRLSPMHAVRMTKNVWEFPYNLLRSRDGVTQDAPGASVTYYHVALPNFLRDNMVLEGGVVAESFGAPFAKANGIQGTKIYTYSERLGGYTRIGEGSIKKTA